MGNSPSRSPAAPPTHAPAPLTTHSRPAKATTRVSTSTAQPIAAPAPARGATLTTTAATAQPIAPAALVPAAAIAVAAAQPIAATATARGATLTTAAATAQPTARGATLTTTDDDDVMEGIDETVADATVAGMELGATSGYTAQALRSIGGSFHSFYLEAKETPNPPDSTGGTKEDESSV